MTRSSWSGAWWSAVAVVSMIAAGCATSPEKQARSRGAAVGDKVAYVDDLARFDESQIALGDLAQTRSSNPNVTELGRQLVNNHSDHLEVLSNWARARVAEFSAIEQMPPASGTGGAGAAEFEGMAELSRRLEKHASGAEKQAGKVEAAHQKLQSLSGAAFDEEFLKTVKKQQRDGRDLVREGIGKYQEDGTFSTLLARTQPVLEGHLQQVEQIEQAMQ
jgi:putative membrane protein